MFKDIGYPRRCMPSDERDDFLVRLAVKTNTTGKKQLRTFDFDENRRIAEVYRELVDRAHRVEDVPVYSDQDEDFKCKNNDVVWVFARPKICNCRKDPRCTAFDHADRCKGLRPVVVLYPDSEQTINVFVEGVPGRLEFAVDDFFVDCDKLVRLLLQAANVLGR